MAIAKPSSRKKSDGTTWADRLRRSKKYQETHSKTWARNHRLLLGPAASAANTTETKANLARRWDTEVAYGWGVIDGILTNVYVQNPDCIVEAYDPMKADTARLLTSVVRHDLDLMDLKSVGNLAVIDCCIAGYGAILEVVENYKSVVAEEDAPPIEGDEEPPQLVTGQNYCARRIQPKDVLFDPAGTLLDLSDHRFIAVASYKTIADLKDDDRFKLPDDINGYPGVTPDSTSNDRDGTVQTPYGESTEEDPAFKTLRVWEVWDRTTGMLRYILDQGYKEIGTAPWPFELKLGGRTLYPLTLMVMRPAPKGFYPIPEVDLVAPQLEQINEIERLIRRDSLTKWRKYLAPAELVSPDMNERLTDTEGANNLILIAHDKLSQYMAPGGAPPDLTKLVVQMEDVSFARDLPARYQMLTQEISHVLGYGPSDRGGLPSTRSAREAVMINESKNQRLVKRADSIEDFYRLFNTKHIQIRQEVMEGDAYARAGTPTAQPGPFVKYNKEAIQGDFQFRIYAGSAAPKTTESKRAEEMQFFQIMAPALQAAGLPIFPLLEKMAPIFNWDGIDELFRNPKAAAQQGVAALVGFKDGTVPSEGLIEAMSTLIASLLSPQELQQLASSPGLIQPGGSAGGLRGDPNRLGTSGGTL